VNILDGLEPKTTLVHQKIITTFDEFYQFVPTVSIDICLMRCGRRGLGNGIVGNGYTTCREKELGVGVGVRVFLPAEIEN
jgi:hypothetical protein